jgi:hypothetical protein
MVEHLDPLLVGPIDAGREGVVREAERLEDRERLDARLRRHLDDQVAQVPRRIDDVVADDRAELVCDGLV